MKLSASIELVWQLAGKEAIAAQFKEIGPEHFWMALLKFAELPVDQTRKIAPGAEAANQLAAEVGDVRDELARREIESTRVRREIRTKLGKGNYAFDGGQIHRSTASRELFDAAARIADDLAAEAFAPKHLLEALLGSPTACIKEVLGEAPQGGKFLSTKTPLLNQHHEDMSDPAGDWQEREVEKNAVIQALAQPQCRCVFLLNDSEAQVLTVLFNLAHTLSEPTKCPRNLKGRPVFNLMALKLIEKEKKGSLDLWEKLFAEATDTRRAILYVPSLEMSQELEALRDWLNLLRQSVSKGAFQCVGRVSPEVYLKCIKPDSAWKSLAQNMWIQRHSQLELPREL